MILPLKVNVKSGDMKTELGEGTYVGDVAVVVLITPEGNLLSMHDATQAPPVVPDGHKLHEIGHNPKIVLDSGDTVYGCQVWWEPVYIGANIRMTVASKSLRRDTPHEKAEFKTVCDEFVAELHQHAVRFIEVRGLDWSLEI